MRRSWTTGWLAIIAAALCAAAWRDAPASEVGHRSLGRTCLHASSSAAVVRPPPLPSDLRYFDDPMNRLPWDDVAVQIEPRETVVPVGSEVILIAGVVGKTDTCGPIAGLNGRLPREVWDILWPSKKTASGI